MAVVDGLVYPWQSKLTTRPFLFKPFEVTESADRLYVDARIMPPPNADFLLV
jgi:hypothetical protein